MAKKITVELSDDLYTQLGALAERRGTFMSGVARLAIQDHLARGDKPPTQQLYVARILCDELRQVLERDGSA